MGLSDKYGGNIDLDAKYGRHESDYELSHNAYIEPGFNDNAYKNLSQDIHHSSILNSQYIELFDDAYTYIDKKKFKSVQGAFDRQIPESGCIQVYAKDLRSIVLATLYITKYCGTHYYDPIYNLISKDEFKKELNKFKALSLEHQRYVNIRLFTGTFKLSEDYHESYYESHDSNFSDIYFFSDGAIYIPTGNSDIAKVPIDYLSKVLEESINKINNGYTTRYVPTITSEIHYDRDIYGPDKGKTYIKKYVIGAER